MTTGTAMEGVMMMAVKRMATVATAEKESQKTQHERQQEINCRAIERDEE
jgi:hypothetical protein